MLISQIKNPKSPVWWSYAIYAYIYVNPVIMMKFQSFQPKTQSSSYRLYVRLFKAPIPTLIGKNLLTNLSKLIIRLTIRNYCTCRTLSAYYLTNQQEQCYPIQKEWNMVWNYPNIEVLLTSVALWLKQCRSQQDK